MVCEQEHSSSYRFTAQPSGTFLRVHGTGENTTPILLRFLADANRAAQDAGCDCVLLVLDFKGPSLSLGSIYTVVSERCTPGRDFRRIACVDMNADHVPDRAELAEVTANKFGVNFRIFRSVAAAEEWLNEAAQV